MIISENLFKSSKNNRVEMLKQHFPQCFDKNGHFLPEKMAEQMQSQGINTSREYYTMNWLGKAYACYLRDCSPTTLLAENVTHNSLPENQNSQNLLIKGDNLEVLKHLKHAYANQVKMIYIDPPYNTGSDGFVYQDNRKFTPEQLSELTEMSLDEAKRVLNFTSKKSNSHSAWLTFMYPRLYIARELLKDDGVIFISIDDNEQAQLKLLCDEVFGEENFLSQMIWQSTPGSNTGTDIKTVTEYIIVYAKSKHQSRVFVRASEFDENKYKFKDEFFAKRGAYTLNKLDRRMTGSHYSEALNYGIELPNGKVLFAGGKSEKQQHWNWRWSKNKLQWGIENGFIVFKENSIYFKQYFNVDNEDNIIERAVPYQNFIKAEGISSATGTSECINIFGRKIFDYPKPLNLLKHILPIALDKNDITLDFFAGSGTTAHAVMELNAEDGGHRQCICVQLPEPANEKSEAYKAGYKTIFDITKARIEKAAQKIKSEHPDYQGDLGFKIFETVDDFLTVSDDEFNPQLNLPETLNRTLSDDEYHTLLTTWRIYDGQALTEAVQAVDLGEYFANWCGDNVYLIYPYFGSEHIKVLLHKLDNDKAFLPKRVILFGRNIDSAKQMELHQAIKTYSNKKNIELNVVVRY